MRDTLTSASGVSAHRRARRSKVRTVRCHVSSADELCGRPGRKMRRELCRIAWAARLTDFSHAIMDVACQLYQVSNAASSGA